MGTFTVAIEVGAWPTPGQFEPLDVVAGTDAMFTVVPAPLLRAAGVEPSDRSGFDTPDGTRVERAMGTATIRFDGDDTPSTVIFGEDGDPIVLGKLALTARGLEADTEHERFVPTTLYLPTMILVPDSERKAVG